MMKSIFLLELKVIWADQSGNNVMMNKFSVRLIEDSVFGM